MVEVLQLRLTRFYRFSIAILNHGHLQIEILLLKGRSRVKNQPQSAVNVADFRDRAKRYLPRVVFDYLEGGAEDERCLHRNRTALDEILLLPRALQDVSECDLGASLFGRNFSAPIILGPTGVNGLYRPNGDVLLARAAARANIPFVLSSPSSNSIEEVAKAVESELWFQLYVIDWDLASRLLDRAKSAGYRVLVVTIDTVVSGKRERDLHNNFHAPWCGSALSWLDSLLHPAWSKKFLVNGPPRFANFAEGGNSNLSQRRMDPKFSWADLKRLRDRWPFHFVVKGILNVSDVGACLRLGADAVVLSNHGGRQLDSVPSGIEMLPYARSQYPNETFFVDGGIRRGSDVVKALAVGAQAVLLGRAPLYGLAADGEHGAFQVIEIIKEEMARTLALLGCRRSQNVDQSYLVPRTNV